MSDAQQSSQPGSLFIPKIFYFFLFGGASCIIPFIPLYYESLGLNGRQIGFLTGIFPLMTLIGSSFWGGAADITNRHRRILNTVIVGAMGMVLLISFTERFIFLIPLVIGFAFFHSPIVPITDNSVMELLGERSHLYGRLRLWGAVGWGIASLLAGLLIEHFSATSFFYVYLAITCGTLLLSFRLPVAATGVGGRYWQNLKQFISKPDWIIFLVIVFIGGMGMAVMQNFLFLYMKTLGAQGSLMGLTMTFATIGEIAVFFFSDRLISKMGTRTVFIVALGANVVRLGAYSVVTAPWMVLGIQLLHGFTFSALWVASVSFARRMSPPGLGATAQGILSAFFFGLAGFTGSMIGGALYESIGPRLMYLIFSGVVAVGLIIFLIFYRKS